MKIAITRLSGKESSDAARCADFGHTGYSVHPLRSETREDVIAEFVTAAEHGDFDAVFFTSALPAKLIAPRMGRVTGARIIAIGPQTAKELQAHGIETETLPSFYSKDFVPYLGPWIAGKRIGIPRAAVPNPALLDAITEAGSIVREFRCYGLEPTGEPLDLEPANAILFTSAMSFTKAIWTPRPDLLVMAIGEITAGVMQKAGVPPAVVGDGSLEGALGALNAYLTKKREDIMTDAVDPAGPEKVHLWSGSGIIVLDKPKGPSSHEVAAWVGKMLGCPVGHSGTLDPQVSGLLLIMLGNAVRLAPLLLQHDKEYVCLMRLHGDVEEERIRGVAEEFTGRLYQRPPRKSAVKRNLRIRTIQEMEVLGIEGRLVLFRAKCDAGTYIRSLCHHMGLALGVGGHMQELRRTRSGTFVEADMHTLHEVQDAAVAAKAGDRAELVSMILPVDRSIPDIPTVAARDTAIDAVCHGAVLAGVGILSCMPFERGHTVVLLSQKNEFIGLGRALVPSTGFTPGQTGLVIAPTTVFMAPGTYPRRWTKSETAVPRDKKPKAPKGSGPAKAPGTKPAYSPRRDSPGKQGNRFWRKR